MQLSFLRLYLCKSSHYLKVLQSKQQHANRGHLHLLSSHMEVLPSFPRMDYLNFFDIWPLHWYNREGGIRCVVHGCFFVTRAASACDQLGELQGHSIFHFDWEHVVLFQMLNQVYCVHPGCNYGNSQTQALFVHEATSHNATSTSRIEGFVTLARNRRGPIAYLDEVYLAIFHRMVDKLYLTGYTTVLMFQQAGLHNPAEQTQENLIEILHPIYLRSWHRPSAYWEPLPAAEFLMNVAPSINAPADDPWRICWSRLRIMYAQGII